MVRIRHSFIFVHLINVSVQFSVVWPLKYWFKMATGWTVISYASPELLILHESHFRDFKNMCICNAIFPPPPPLTPTGDLHNHLSVQPSNWLQFYHWLLDPLIGNQYECHTHFFNADLFIKKTYRCQHNLVHHVWCHNNLCDVTINITDGWHGNNIPSDVTNSWWDRRPIETTDRDGQITSNFFQILSQSIFTIFWYSLP